MVLEEGHFIKAAVLLLSQNLDTDDSQQLGFCDLQPLQCNSYEEELR